MYTTQSGSPKKENPAFKEYCVAPTLRNTYLQHFDDMYFTHIKPPCGNHTLWFRDNVTPPPPHVPCTHPLLPLQGTQFQATIIPCLKYHTRLLTSLWLPHYSHSLSSFPLGVASDWKAPPSHLSGSSSSFQFWLKSHSWGDFAWLAYLKFPNYSLVPSPI